MKLNKTQIITMGVMLLILVLPTLSHAQPDFSGGGGDDVVDVPIDGGLTLLVAAGVGYGAKKLRGKGNK